MLQYLVILAGTDPLVWRRIQVPATYSFWDLHVAIQDAMGWLDYHLHMFQAVDPDSRKLVRFGIPDPDGADELKLIASWRACPLDFTSESAPQIQYTYDFGDGWRHTIIFEGYERTAQDQAAPVCVAGAGACPPEDSGGVARYTELVTILKDPDHPEHDEMMGWADKPIDPSAFSVEDVHFHDPRERWQRAFAEGAI